MRRLPLAALLCCSCATVQVGNLAESGGAGLRSIKAEALSARIRFLSDDLLEGRFTGSRGHAIAERYVASELAALGLEPAGSPGSFHQAVPLRSAQRDLSTSMLSIGGGAGPEESLKPDDEYILQSDLRTQSVDLSGALVFAGYAVIAPEYKYDDLEGLDLKGKIAVVFHGAPLSDRQDFFPPVAHAVLGDGRAKLRRLAARGAIGVISVFRPEDESRLPWNRVVSGSRLPQMSWMKDGEPGATVAGVPLRGMIHWKAFEKILVRGGIPGGLAALDEKAKANTLKAFDLNATAHGRLNTTFASTASGNVVGILRGSDPKLNNEYVVYSAHLDHLGIGAPIDGDTMYNGALDNASGMASVLEIARAFASQPERPKRSILFVFVTGEERGLLGSEYYANNPTVPTSAMVANINIDMLVPLRHVYDVYNLGLDHSTLDAHARAAAAALKLTVSPDPNPKQMSFIRSDQYSFVKKGVPAMYFSPGLADEKGDLEAGRALRRQWIATRYHSPKDKWDPAYDYESMAQVVRADFLTGLSVANAKERPRWNPGDFFSRFPEKQESAH